MDKIAMLKNCQKEKSLVPKELSNEKKRISK